MSKSGSKSAPRLPDGRVAPGRGPKKGAANAGRPPIQFSQLCREIATRENLLEKAAAIACGKEGETVTLPDGVTTVMLSKPAERLAATKLILAYGHGQPVQPVDLDATMPHEDALTDLE